MGTRVYNNLPKSLNEINDYKVFNKELKIFLLFQSFYSVEDLYPLKDVPAICIDIYFICCIDIYILLICTVNNVYMLRM